MSLIDNERAPNLFDRLQLNGMAGALLLIVLVVACYGYCTSFSYIWDDDTYLLNNLNMRDVAGLSRMWTHIGATPQYYPITFTSFWLEFQLFGPNAARPNTDRLIMVAHGVNMLLHMASVLMLWTILRRLAVPGALLAAALFAVHPLNVESVAWIAERKNTLSLMFGLAALFVYLRYIGVIAAPLKAEPKPARAQDSKEEEDDEGIQFSLPEDPRRLYFLFVILFVCALLSKTTLSVLPGVILVIIWWKRGRLVGRDFVPLILPLVLGALAGATTSYIEQSPYLVGATGRAWDHGFVDRLALAGQVSWFYIGKLLAPHPFVLQAPESINARTGTIDLLVNVPKAMQAWLPQSLCFNYAKWQLDSTKAVQWIGSLTMAATVVGLWLLRKNLGRGALACVLIYLGCLFPAMGFVNVYPMHFSWVADHFAYVAAISLMVLFAAGMSMLLRRVNAGVQLGLGAVVIAILGIFTVLYSTTFRDAKTLWGATTVRNENSWLAATNLGGIWIASGEVRYKELMRQGNQTDAEKAYIGSAAIAELWLRRGLKLNENSYQAEYQLARLYKGLTRYEDALFRALRADEIAIREGAVSYIYPKLMIADLLTLKNESEKARQIYIDLQSMEGKIADRLPTTFADARMRLAAMDMKKLSGPVTETISGGDRALLGAVIENLSIACEIAPMWSPPRLQLARILIDLGKVTEASQELVLVISKEPNNPEAKYLSALGLIKVKEFQAAAAQLSNLIQIDPGNIPARVRFAETLRQLKRDADAKEQLQEALKVNPNDAEARKLLIELGGTPPPLRPTTVPSTMPSTLPSTIPSAGLSPQPTASPATLPATR